MEIRQIEKSEEPISDELSRLTQKRGDLNDDDKIRMFEILSGNIVGINPELAREAFELISSDLPRDVRISLDQKTSMVENELDARIQEPAIPGGAIIPDVETPIQQDIDQEAVESSPVKDEEIEPQQLTSGRKKLTLKNGIASIGVGALFGTLGTNFIVGRLTDSMLASPLAHQAGKLGMIESVNSGGPWIIGLITAIGVNLFLRRGAKNDTNN